MYKTGRNMAAAKRSFRHPNLLLNYACHSNRIVHICSTINYNYRYVGPYVRSWVHVRIPKECRLSASWVENLQNRPKWGTDIGIEGYKGVLTSCFTMFTKQSVLGQHIESTLIPRFFPYLLYVFGTPQGRVDRWLSSTRLRSRPCTMAGIVLWSCVVDPITP